VNEPGRLGDQSRWMGQIRSRITNDVNEKTLVELKLKNDFMTKVKMRRESPIHAILNPPDKQSLNHNSSCTMKEAITNISQQLKNLN
jgi:predicted P-loop ATPase/GTPase